MSILISPYFIGILDQIQEATPQCSIPGQVYKKCGTACPPSCAVPNPLCLITCVPGCQCAAGTVLSGSGDRCIPLDDCKSLYNYTRGKLCR